MLTMIEVKCPHCGAQGQIMLPPLGSIIVGPCPECEGMVCIFSGRVLPLDTKVMTEADSETRKEHLYRVLNGFLRDRLDKLFGAKEAPHPTEPIEDQPDLLAGDDGLDFEGARLQESAINPFENIQEAPITVEEIQSFCNVELKLIDNPEYFKAVFRN